MRRGLGTGIAAVAIAVCGTAPAQGAITVGSDLERAPIAFPCSNMGFSPIPCTLAIAGLDPADAAPGGPTVPQDGVIVRWRVRRAGGPSHPTVQASFRVIRGDTGAGKSADVPVPGATGVHEFPTRLPVRAGDQIGLDFAGATAAAQFNITLAGFSVPAADSFDVWTTPPLAEGPPARPPSGTGTQSELMINADVEPDADGDGFGDETQDLCPSNAATQQACAAGAPDTSFTEKPKKKSKKTKRTAEFTSNVAGATFQCSLDSVAFTACASPLKLKGLKKGKHILLVRALVNGVADPTPAEARFTVKKKKKKGK